MLWQNILNWISFAGSNSSNTNETGTSDTGGVHGFAHLDILTIYRKIAQTSRGLYYFFQKIHPYDNSTPQRFTSNDNFSYESNNHCPKYIIWHLFYNYLARNLIIAWNSHYLARFLIIARINNYLARLLMI